MLLALKSNFYFIKFTRKKQFLRAYRFFSHDFYAQSFRVTPASGKAYARENSNLLRFLKVVNADFFAVDYDVTIYTVINHSIIYSGSVREVTFSRNATERPI